MLRSVRRAGQAAARVSESAADLFEAGANATASVVDVAVEAVVVASSVLDELARGVDLVNVSLGRVAIKAVGDSKLDLASYVCKGARSTVPLHGARAVAAAIEELPAGIPAIETAGDFFDPEGVYWAFWLRARTRVDGTAVASFWVANASFEAVWINPVWHGLGYPVASQRDRIAAQLKQTILNMKALPASVFEISDQAIYRDFGLVLGWRAHLRSRRGFVLAVGLTWGVCLASNAFFASGLFGRLCPRLAQRLRPAVEVSLDAFQVVERYLVAADTAITEEGHQ